MWSAAADGFYVFGGITTGRGPRLKRPRVAETKTTQRTTFGSTADRRWMGALQCNTGPSLSCILHRCRPFLSPLQLVVLGFSCTEASPLIGSWTAGFATGQQLVGGLAQRRATPWPRRTQSHLVRQRRRLLRLRGQRRQSGSRGVKPWRTAPG